jgi:hypothetical protein
MPLVFNPFDPSSYLQAWSDAVSRASLGSPREPRTAPIPVDVKNDDPGIAVSTKGSAGRVELEFSGRAAGPAVKPRSDGVAAYWDPQPKSRVVSLGVATGEAPTTDAFGRKSFAEKNARSMVQSTRAGETGRAIAEDFAEQIGRHLVSFRAEVVPGTTPDAATLVITRR